MKVKALIKALYQYPPDAEIHVEVSFRDSVVGGKADYMALNTELNTKTGRPRRTPKRIAVIVADREDETEHK